MHFIGLIFLVTLQLIFLSCSSIKNYGSPYSVDLEEQEPVLNQSDESLMALNYKLRKQDFANLTKEDIDYESIFSLNSSVNKVAFLLPLSGPKKPVGEKIRAGLELSNDYYKSYITLSFYDTAATSLAEIYKKAKLEDGNDWIVGPIESNKVAELEAIANEYQDKKIIILNGLDHQLPVTDKSILYFNANADFGSQIKLAKEFIAKGYQKIAIVADPKNLNHANFLQRLINKTQTISAEILVYEKNNRYMTYRLQKFLGISQSKNRRANIAKIIGKPLVLEKPFTRKDFDALAIIASNANTSLIRPLFKFYSVDLPIYATSSVIKFKSHLTQDFQKVQLPVQKYKFQNLEQSLLTSYSWDIFVLISQLNKLKDAGKFVDGLQSADDLDIFEYQIYRDMPLGVINNNLTLSPVKTN